MNSLTLTLTLTLTLRRKQIFHASDCILQKVRDGGLRIFYYLFLYHDVSCNITQQLIKNKLIH